MTSIRLLLALATWGMTAAAPAISGEMTARELLEAMRLLRQEAVALERDLRLLEAPSQAPASSPSAHPPGFDPGDGVPAGGQTPFSFPGEDLHEALARLLAGQHQTGSRNEKRRDSGGGTSSDRRTLTWTLAWLQALYGLPGSDDDTLARLLREIRPVDQARAWLMLGERRYREGDFPGAAAALRRTMGRLPPDLQPRGALLLAQSLLAQGRAGEAAEHLRGMSAADMPWQAYGRYNLAVALLAQQKTADALAILDALGRQASDNEELAALRDQANITLGFARLRLGDNEAARTAFNRVRLNGPFSSHALLGLGRAAWRAGTPRPAQAFWARLAERDPADPLVQEALLGIPRSLWRLKSHTQAGKRFRQAAAVYERQLSRLDRLITVLDTPDRKGAAALLEALSTAGADTQNALPDHPLVPHLSPLLLDHRFQAGLARLQALQTLDRHLAGARARLAALPASPRTAALLQRQAHLQGRLQQLRRAQSARLENRIRDELAQQRRRLQDYLITARFEFARLLDEMAADTGAGRP